MSIIDDTDITSTPAAVDRTQRPAPEGQIATPPGYETRWVALAVVMTAAFMDLVDVTIVNVGLPRIREQLGSSYAGVQWITAAYSLAFGAGLISGGRLGDIFGRKRLFMLGMTGFTLASALCGLAGSTEILIVARVLQGIGAAAMVPQVLSIINVTFPAAERPKVFGLYGAMVGLATVAGPILGAVLTNLDIAGLDWRPIFLVNIPIGLAGLALGARYLTETRSEHPLRLDPVGTILVTVGLVEIMYPLTMGRDLGWPAWSFGLITFGALKLVAFWFYEGRLARSGRSPLVDPQLFRIRSFAGGIGVQFFFSIAMAIFFLVWTIYLQIGLGWSVLKAGLTAAPYSAAVGVAAGLSVGLLVPRLGRRVLQAGAVLMGGGALAYGALDRSVGAEITPWQMLPALIVMGLGMGMIIAPLTDATLADVPDTEAGSASGFLSTTTQAGWALGLGLVSVAFLAPIDDALAALGHSPSAGEVAATFGAGFASSMWWVAAPLAIAGVLVSQLPARATSGIPGSDG